MPRWMPTLGLLLASAAASGCRSKVHAPARSHGATAAQDESAERDAGTSVLAGDARADVRDDAGEPPLPPPPAAAQALPAGEIRWIAAGGGADPESNQVSLAQDLELARSVLGPEGVVLFAAGNGSAVQVLDRSPRGDALLRALGELFDPRGGRDAHYATAALRADGPASAEGVRAALVRALGQGEHGLLLFVAAHGEAGDTAAENRVALWAQTELRVRELAALLDATPTRRTLRVVVESCFGGGFAELAFRAASEGRGAASGRCGLFATTWDREATGCDPDPDRRQHESYGLYVLNALRGRDRDGRALAIGEADLDGDGRVGLLEAHTWARRAARSIDVPTTTSERWLRAVAPAAGSTLPVVLPEEDAVIRDLARELRVAPELAAARARLAEVEARRDALQGRLGPLDDAAQDAARVQIAALLARWPALDDPWHPDFARTLRADRDAIAAALRDAPEARARADAEAARDELALESEPLELLSARLTRLVRALENRVLAGRLRALGDARWATYQRLLDCERAAPF